MSWDDILGIVVGTVGAAYIIFTVIWFIKLYREDKKEKPMTNFEKIKSLDVDQMARFMLSVEYDEVVPRKYCCDKKFCAQCDENLSCYTKWLKAEAKIKKDISL